MLGARVRSVFKLTPRFLTWIIKWLALTQFLVYMKPSVTIYRRDEYMNDGTITKGIDYRRHVLMVTISYVMYHM